MIKYREYLWNDPTIYGDLCVPVISYQKGYEEGFLAAKSTALDLEDKYSGQFRLRKYLELIGEEE